MITIINDKKCHNLERKIIIIEEKIENDLKEKKKEKNINKKAGIIYLKETKKVFAIEDENKISRIK